MATPNEASVQAQIGRTIHILDELRKFANVNTPNLEALIDASTQGMDTDFAPEVTAAVDAIREGVSDAMNEQRGSDLLTPLLRQYAKTLNFPETDPLAIVSRIRFEWQGRTPTPDTIKSREFNFGAVGPVGTPVGNGTIHRLTVDAYGYPIESATPEEKRFAVVQDVNSGATKHQEVFAIRGSLTPRDLVDGYVGDDRETDSGLTGLTAANSNGIGFTNMSFENALDGSSSDLATALPGWVIAGAVSNLETVSANIGAGTGLDDFYREIQAEGNTPSSLRFSNNETITQELGRTARATFDALTPYYFQIAVKRESSADGTLTLTVGAATVAVDVSTLTDDAWSILQVPIGAANWLDSFNADPFKVQLAYTARTTGTILVDDIIIAPFTRWDGTWWAAVGGRTAWLYNDILKADDTVASANNDAKIQLWFIRSLGYDGYLNASTSPTWTDPT